MRTTIELTKEQVRKLIIVLKRQYDNFDEKNYPEHNDWKLEFNNDGSILVWSGCHGFSTKEVKE